MTAASGAAAAAGPTAGLDGVDACHHLTLVMMVPCLRSCIEGGKPPNDLFCSLEKRPFEVLEAV